MTNKQALRCLIKGKPLCVRRQHPFGIFIYSADTHDLAGTNSLNGPTAIVLVRETGIIGSTAVVVPEKTVDIVLHRAMVDQHRVY